MKYQSHPLKLVVPYSGLDLICYFKNGEVKKFNFKQVIDRYPEFKALEEGDLFYHAHVDLGGLCVSFNDELDISEETLYQKGIKFDVKKENEKLMKAIYSYCKHIRKESNITQNQLSCLSKIPQSGIARIESGNSDVQLGTLTSYLDPLGYKIEIVKK